MALLIALISGVYTSTVQAETYCADRKKFRAYKKCMDEVMADLESSLDEKAAAADVATVADRRIRHATTASDGMVNQAITNNAPEAPEASGNTGFRFVTQMVQVTGEAGGWNFLAGPGWRFGTDWSFDTELLVGAGGVSKDLMIGNRFTFGWNADHWFRVHLVGMFMLDTGTVSDLGPQNTIGGGVGFAAAGWKYVQVGVDIIGASHNLNETLANRWGRDQSQAALVIPIVISLQL